MALLRALGFSEVDASLAMDEPQATAADTPHDGTSCQLLLTALEDLGTLRQHRHARDLAAYGQTAAQPQLDPPPWESLVRWARRHDATPTVPTTPTTPTMPLLSTHRHTNPSTQLALARHASGPGGSDASGGHWVTEEEMWARTERHAGMPPPPPPGAAPSSNGRWGRG